eukprot:TRINITY_DN4832_c0_g1_i3.p4 TRINITY_DN4832_c0_g1~~TRINITY_DN4832_c0_g1_i3.p4  ORF type:complete len:142 (-),score=28.69 TRINITY_DN4832_c0_g1_i3:604-1029(-)
MLKLLEGLRLKDINKRIEGKLKKFNFQRARMLIQQRNCIEQYNLKLNPETGSYEFPYDIEENKYMLIEPAYLGKQKSCVVKDTNEPLEPDKAKLLLNDMAVKEEYRVDVGNEIINNLRKFLDIGKKVLRSKSSRGREEGCV